MAKALFASLPHQKPTKPQKDVFTGELGKKHGNFHDLLRALTSQNNHNVNIGWDILPPS